MKSTVALLTCALAVSTIASAQMTSSKPAHKPSAGITRDSNLPAETPSTTPTRARDNGNSLPVGTAIKMKLETALTTTTSKAGDNFAGRVTEAVTHNGRTIIPVGSSITGRVVRVDEPRRIKGLPTINLHPEAVMLPDGTSYSINAVVVDTDTPRMNVDEEGGIQGSGATKGEKLEIAAGTTGGTVIGAMAGGGKGALIGGTIGAVATVTHWLTKTHTAELPIGTEIVMELSRDMVISASRTAEGN